MTPALVPELTVSDLTASLAFYRDLLGFRIMYDRPAAGFAYLKREGAEIMLEERSEDSWITGPLTAPHGRGVSFQIETADVHGLLTRVTDADYPLFRPLEDAWYRAQDHWLGNRQFLLQDPDGFLLRFFQDLGTASEPALLSGRVVS